MLSLTAFYLSRNQPDGLQPACKQCQKDQRLATKDRDSAKHLAYRKAHKEEALARSRAWALAHPERTAALARASYERHKELVLARGRDWRQANLEHAAAVKRAYYQKHPEKALNKNRIRSALKKNAFVEDVEQEAVIARDRGICGICQKPVEPRDVTLDHIIPLSKGGEHSYKNIQLAHRSCNGQKADRVLQLP